MSGLVAATAAFLLTHFVTSTPLRAKLVGAMGEWPYRGLYSLVAFILALNKIVPDDAVMDAAALPKVKMPARDRFVIDNRKGGKVVK